MSGSASPIRAKAGAACWCRSKMARGALLVNLILGVETSGALCAPSGRASRRGRREGELPPLRDVASWLDLRPIDIARRSLGARGNHAARRGAPTSWRATAPSSLGASRRRRWRRLRNRASRRPRSASRKLRRWTCARRRPSKARRVARVRATTFDGVVIDAELIPSDGRPWVKLVRARRATPEQEAAALEINNRVVGLGLCAERYGSRRRWRRR